MFNFGLDWSYFWTNLSYLEPNLSYLHRVYPTLSPFCPTLPWSFVLPYLKWKRQSDPCIWGFGIYNLFNPCSLPIWVTFKGFAYSERLWTFSEWKPCYENNFNIFLIPIFFILSEIKELIFGFKDFQLFTLWRRPLLGHIMPYLTLTPTVSQTKWPKQLDF